MIKKFKKSFMSLILFLMYANNIYATTTGTYTVSENGSGIGKIILLLVGVLLVSLVLFAGYVMDKNENTKKEREKFIKKHKEKENSESDTEIEKDDYEDYDEEEDSEEDNKEDNEDDENNSDELEDENYYTQRINLTTEYDKEEEDSIESLNDLERNLIEKYIDEDDLEDTEESDEEVDEDELENSFEDSNKDYDDNNEEDDSENYEDEEDEILIRDNSYNDVAENLMNSTMIFNSTELKIEEKNENTVKGYDYEEDDLSEIESMIKAANIKRYTRKKTKGEELLKPRKKVIVFKKEKNDNDIIANTRRKMAESKEAQKPKRGRPPKNSTEDIIEKDVQEASKEVKVPAKRGRKPGSKNKPKEPAKRGRKPGSKNKTTAKKRGRPPKKTTKKTVKKDK